MKNKKIKSIVCIFLALFSLSATACTEETSSVEERKPETKKVVWDEGTHIFNSTDTEYDFVKDGATEYRLVVSDAEKQKDGILAARSEFCHFFKEATGINIPVVTDVGLTHSASNKYISLGNTTLAESAGVEVDTLKLTWEGTQIDTVDQTIFITGGSDYGVVYGVYDFMTIMFNYEFYFLDTYDIDKGVRNAKLKDFDVTDIPDFETRCTGMGYASTPAKSGVNGFRYRTPYGYGTFLQRIHKGWADRENLIYDMDSARSSGHNSLYYVPKEQYQAEHPGWYSTAGQQLCYTARGNEEERLLLAKEIADKIKGAFKAYPPSTQPLWYIASCSMEDNGEICQCEACMANTAKYGEPVAAVIQLLNIVNDDVQAWMKEQVGQPWYREKIRIQFFAYSGFKMAPAHWDETKGEYVPNDPSVVCGEGLGVWECPAPFDVQQDMYAYANSTGLENVKKWGACAKEVYYWTKGTNFRAYLTMFDTFGHYTSETMQLYKANGGIQYFQQMQGSSQGSTAFHNLKMYLMSKLAWDCTLDDTELIDKWFKGVYKEAAATMKELWMQERYYAAQIGTKYNLYQPVAAIILENKKFWNYNVQKSWVDLTSKALDEVAHYQNSNPELYKVLKTNIETEFIYPGYYLLQYFSSSMSSKELKELQTRFKEAYNLSQVTMISESGALLEDYVRDF